MKKILLLSFLLVGFYSNSFAQVKDSSYNRLWSEIDSLLLKKGLPKSALQKVNSLYSKAKAANKPDEQIKALLYRMSIEEQVTETDINNKIQAIAKEISDAKDIAESSVLQVILANIYKTFFENNSYRFYQRSATANFDSKDVNTWSISDFDKKIAALYADALRPASILQKQSTERFEAIVIKGNTESLRPTLYDLLAHKALDYFKGNNNYITKPSFAFEIKEPAAMAPAATFTGYTFSSVDSSSHLLRSIKLFQQLMQFHSGDVDPSAFIDVNLERIEWVYENALMENKDSLYKAALEDITRSNPDNAVAAEAWYLIAKIYADNAQKYQPFGDTAYRYDYIKAKQIIEERLKKQTEKSEGRNNMQRLLNEISKKSLNTQVESVNVPGIPFRMFVQYRNVDTMHIRIINGTDLEKLKDVNRYDENFWKAVTQLSFVKTYVQPLAVTNDLQQHATEIKTDALPPGSYAVLGSSSVSFNDSTDKLILQQFDVSAISYISSGADYFVLDRESGQPIKNVSARYEFYKWDYQERKYQVSIAGNIKPDEHGYFSMKDILKGRERNYTLTFYSGVDSLKTRPGNYYIPYSNDAGEMNIDSADYEKQHTQFYFFTDRSIYRPGQTVYFKAIAITKDKTTEKPKSALINKQVKLILKDVNSRQVDTLSAFLNDYGSLKGSFRLPQNLLTGNFSIMVDQYNGNASFNIEEYKRPKFFISFDTVKATYRLNDTIRITGYAKAYAGNNIGGAKIKFNVRRETRFIYPWMFWRKIRPVASPQQIAEGELITGADGKFEINFISKPDASLDRSTDPVFDFQVEATATDINGETRDGSTVLSIGYKSLQLQLDMPSVAEVNKFDSIAVFTRNFSGANVPAIVKLTIYPLKAPDKIYRSRYWQRPDQFVMTRSEYENLFPYDEYEDESDHRSWEKEPGIFSDSVNSAASSVIRIDKAVLKQGWYVVEAISKDKDGNEVKDIQYVQLYDERSATLPSPRTDWSIALKNTGQPGEKARLLLGTNEKDLYVIQQLQRNAAKDEAFEYNYFQLAEQKKIIETDITEDSRKGLGLYYAFVKHNRVYKGGMNISVPYNDKNLEIIYKTFRNKTEPGSKEQWTIEVKGNKKENVAAELLTAMYDASLDQFNPHSWNIPDVWQLGYTSNAFEGRDNFSVIHSEENNIEQPFEYFEQNYDELAVSGEDFWYGGTERRLTGRVPGIAVVAAEANAVRRVPTAPALEQEAQALGIAKSAKPKTLKDEEVRDDLSASDSVAITSSKKEQVAFQPRKNFEETAFFIPQLNADTAGNYSFVFTIPEALTQWKWISFAHTKELAFGYREEKVITQKTLMVQPNLPRFVREGDQMEFVARISNLSDTVLTGKSTLQLFDAITNDPVDGLFQSVFPEQYFTAEAGGSAETRFPVTVPFGFNRPLIVKIMAAAANYADGEENTFAVLTNRMLVTETLPLYMRGEGTKHFRFEKLATQNSPTLTNENITVEYTPNPIWFAIQALPYVAEAKNECAEQIFNRFYANALAAWLAKRHPRIREVFEKWKADTIALKSNLEKNQELKQLLIEETPWVLDAANETQQMKNIALLFDVMKMSTEMNATLQQLQQTQLPDGSFPWFKGGYPDRYITQVILTGIGRLKLLQAIPAEHMAILNEISAKALAYCDELMTREYNILLKSKSSPDNDHLSYGAIQYLFMRSYFNDMALANKSAINYYTSQAMKYWNKRSVYMKGLIAVALSRNNFKAYVDKNIIPSILESTVNDESKGMYFKNMLWGYYWYQNPIEQQALMIELLNEMATGNNEAKMKNAVNEMRTWLLLNKQTNNWKTTKATADACYALLLNSGDELNENRTVQIRLGDKLIVQNSATEGTGYTRQRISGKEITNSSGNIQISVQSQGSSENKKSPSWGVVYWQYFEDLDKITSSATPLSITKKLFIEKNTASGKLLTPVNNNDELKQGDKVIIRMELRSDRDMEYLHLKDMRAAAMEPLNVLSEYKSQDGLGYYEATKDASTNFFISFLPKGTYVFEYPVYITQTGNFSVGIASIQCMYAPDFSSHSEGIRINSTTEK